MKTTEDWIEAVFNNREPVYLQVIRHFKVQIVTGRLGPGQVIPSRRELGSLMKINPNTVQRAYKEMEEQQLIVTEGNSPSRITLDEDILRAIRSELIGEAVEAFVTAIHRIDMPVEELLALVKEKYIQSKQQVQQLETGGGQRD